MNQLRIHLSTEYYKNNNFGEFFVQLGDYYFPNEGWTDFGQRVIFDWLNKLTSFFSKQSEIAVCKFMDGNFRFDVESTENSTQLNLKFIKERSESDEIEHQEIVDTNQFIQEILRIVKEIRTNCEVEENFDAVNRIEESVKRFEKATDDYMQS